MVIVQYYFFSQPLKAEAGRSANFDYYMTGGI
jgi:hypothetical protein